MRPCPSRAETLSKSGSIDLIVFSESKIAKRFISPKQVSLGFDPIWYGVLYTITCQIAYMTPPFGYNLFLMRAMAPKEITLQDIYRSIIPFVLIMVLGLAIVMAFPEIATYLPEKYLSR